MITDRGLTDGTTFVGRIRYWFARLQFHTVRPESSLKQTRVRELAREFGTTSEALLKLLWGRGFTPRNASSKVDAFALEWLRFEFTVDQPVVPPPSRTPARVSPANYTLTRVPEARGRTGVVDATPRRWRYRWRDPFFTRVAEGGEHGRPPARSTRSTPLFGSKPAEITSLDLGALEAGLVGSPYSLPAEQAEYLRTSFLPRVAALSIRALQELQQLAADRRSSLRRISRSSEIYESNKIEGLGPDLATTDRVLHDNALHRLADISVAHGAIQRCLNAEPKVRDVVGLGAARLLAEIFCSEPSRPLTESDIRDLHELVMVGDSRGGSYKAHVNEIAGSNHVPPAPSDTPAAMSELVSWLASTQLAPMWRAAVAHAWLTHIHPFHDGNGRIARILTNLVLIREGMPPLIVSASVDRGAYINALAASDEGGDILPLARVFRDVLSRTTQDLRNPDFAIELFDSEVERPRASYSERWNVLLNEFLSELAPHLLLHRLNLYSIGEVAAADLTRLRSGRSENAWIAKVGAPGTSRDLLLHVASPTRLSQDRRPQDDLGPSVFVSMRSERTLDARQYLPVGQTNFTYEFTPLVETDSILIRREGSTVALPVHEAARISAEHLARAFRQLIWRP